MAVNLPDLCEGTGLPDQANAGGSTSGHLLRNNMQIATDLIKSAIRAGQIQPGERVNEIKLADRFGISRTPIRAALQELAGAGYLVYERNKGYSLRIYSDSEISIAYEARATLEGLAVRIVAEQGLSKANQAILEQNILTGEQAVDVALQPDEAVRRFRQVNAEFHQTLMDAAHSDLLRALIDACQTVPIAAPQNIESFSRRYLRIWQEDHCRIFECILAREPVRAERLMREHVSGLRSFVLLNRTRAAR